VFAKREHNMALILKSGDNRIQPIAGRRIGQVGTVEKTTEFTAERLCRSRMDACLTSPKSDTVRGRFHFSVFVFNHAANVHLHESIEPVLMKIVFQFVESGGSGLFQIENLSELQNIFSGDIAVTDFE